MATSACGSSRKPTRTVRNSKKRSEKQGVFGHVHCRTDEGIPNCCMRVHVLHFPFCKQILHSSKCVRLDPDKSELSLGRSTSSAARLERVSTPAHGRFVAASPSGRNCSAVRSTARSERSGAFEAFQLRYAAARLRSVPWQPADEGFTVHGHVCPAECQPR